MPGMAHSRDIMKATTFGEKNVTIRTDSTNISQGAQGDSHFERGVKVQAGLMGPEEVTSKSVL